MSSDREEVTTHSYAPYGSTGAYDPPTGSPPAAISNQVFIATLFQDCPEGTAPMVCSFPGDPGADAPGKWAARPALSKSAPAAIRRPEKLNTYLCVSAFKPDSEGAYHRRKTEFVALCTVMIDDIGTGPGAKLPPDVLMRLPDGATGLIETSPDNYQAWLRLDPVITDLDQATRLIDALIKQGLMARTDPGMAGVTRYGRLPIGLNGKLKYRPPGGQPWQVRMVRWSPEVSYSPDDLVECFGLDLNAAKGDATRQSIQVDPGKDPYLAMLNQLGIVKGQRENIYDITCPWRHEHTGGADSGSAYISPTGFKCWHGHCAERNFKDLKRWLSEQGMDTAAADIPARPGWNTPLPDHAPPDGGLKWTCMADISARPVDWLWYPYIPLAANTILAGDSDTGKTKATASIVAAVTRGGGLPGMPQRKPASVVMLCAEEDPASMVKPALMAAGADCKKIHLLSANVEILEHGRLKRRLLSLQEDIGAISAKVREIADVGLVVVDPISAYLGERVDPNNGGAIRQLFLNLQQLAEQHGLANLLHHHYGKSNFGYRAKEKILNSVQIVAAARSAIVIEPDPGDDARRLWLPVKANLVPRHDRIAKSFCFETAYINDGNGDIPQGKVVWDPEDLHLTADEVQAMASIKTKLQEGDSKQGEILNLLKDRKPLSSKQIAEHLHNCCMARGDKQWNAVRKMVSVMVMNGLIKPAGKGAYTLP